MRFRPNRRLLADAMAEAVTVSTHDDLMDHLRRIRSVLGPFNTDRVKVEPYHENQWIVTDDRGVIGFVEDYAAPPD